MKTAIRKFVADHKILLVSIFATESARGIFIICSTLIMTRLIDDALNACFDRSSTTIVIICIVMCLRLIVENVRSKSFSDLSLTVQQIVRQKLHAAIFSVDAKTFRSGELLTLIFDTTARLDEFFTKMLPQVSAMIVLTPLILIVAALLDPLTALIFLITLPIAPFLLYLIGRAVAEKNRQAWTELTRLNGIFVELLNAITTLKMFRQSKPALERLKATSERSSAAILDVLKLAFVSAFALELITTLSIALAAVTLGLRLAAGKVEFMTAFVLLLLAPEFFSPIRQIGAAFHSVIDAKQAIDRLKPLIDQAAASSVKASTVSTRMPPSIRLVDVSFTYPEKKSPVLTKLNLSIDAGKIVVITGASGSGKSTLLKLIAGLITPSRGEIFINDLPMSKMDRASLIGKISYVPQQPRLFKASMLENVAVFADNVEVATIKRLIASVGLSVGIDENHTLSRGQLQRLGLARALIKDAPIVILDEPTASLDLETERSIIDLIVEYSRRRTVIIAAHRAAVISIADEVIDIDV